MLQNKSEQSTKTIWQCKQVDICDLIHDYYVFVNLLFQDFLLNQSKTSLESDSSSSQKTCNFGTPNGITWLMRSRSPFYAYFFTPDTAAEGT